MDRCIVAGIDATDMGVTMELQFDSTRDFERGIEALSADERSRVVASINECAGTSTLLIQPYLIALPDRLESSLYVLKATRWHHVILAIDEDPVFDRKILTLFRLVPSEEAEPAFLAVAGTLYQDLPVVWAAND